MNKISEKDIQQLKAKVDILRVFSELGIALRKKGHLYWCCCPIHKEKTPSMAVDPVKNTWHCYGCGKGGDAIALLSEVKGLGFYDALKWLAEVFNFEFTRPEAADPKEEEAYRVKRSLMEVNKAAMRWFVGQLNEPMHQQAKEYVLGRWNEDSVRRWEIGYAPKDATWLWDDLLRQGFRAELLMQSSLFVRDDKDKPYCAFSGRVMMPVFSTLGEPIGFCGRIFPTPPPRTDETGRVIPVAKYKNTGGDDPLYKKSEVFYGWNFALREIKKSHEAVVVEGNPDVIKMHELGVANVVAACGTSMSKGHRELLKKNCHAVTLLYDNDTAGQNHIEKNGEELMREGVTTYALTIPEGENGEKQDPDTYFESKAHYEEFCERERLHYVVWLVKRHKDDFRDPSQASQFMARVCELLLLMAEPEALGYIEVLSGMMADKSMWNAAYKECRRANKAVDTVERFGFSDEDSLLERYGFLIDNNCYYVWRGFSEKSRPVQVSNFTLQPIFLITSSVNAKRIFKMTNCHGYSIDLEISQRDLGSRSAFKTAVASRGNFQFVGKDEDLDKIMAYLYDNTKSCVQIDQLGWQPKGRFWAWSNGIHTPNGQFIPVDEQGTVQYDGQWYYLPACSSTTAEDKEFYQFERRFLHKGSDIDLMIWAEKYIATFGDNAVMGLCYAVASLFRDVAFAKFRSFPLLNVFGQRGTGKTKFIMSLLRLFGDSEEGPSLESGTKAAISDHMSKMHNGFVHLDEYKNNVSPEVIGLLKGAYESRGRLKMDMDRDKKRMQTSMDCGLIISGQEMTTADNALFSRTIYLTFQKAKFTNEQRDTFEDLKEYERRSMTPITNYLLGKRDIVEQGFLDAYKAVKDELRQQVTASKIDGRIFESYATVLAYMKVLDGKIGLPFGYKDLVPKFANYMVRQNDAVNENNEMSEFWHALQAMLFQREINLGQDMVVRHGKTGLSCYKGQGRDRRRIEYTQPYDVVYLNPDPIFSAYQKYAKQHRTSGANIIPASTLKYYLTAQDEYMGDFSTSFTLPEELRKDASQPDHIKARALVFNYRSLVEGYGIDFDISPLQTEIDSAAESITF